MTLILPSTLNLNGTVVRTSRPFSCATCRTWRSRSRPRSRTCRCRGRSGRPRAGRSRIGEEGLVELDPVRVGHLVVGDRPLPAFVGADHHHAPVAAVMDPAGRLRAAVGVDRLARVHDPARGRGEAPGPDDRVRVHRPSGEMPRQPETRTAVPRRDPTIAVSASRDLRNPVRPTRIAQRPPVRPWGLRARTRPYATEPSLNTMIGANARHMC